MKERRAPMEELEKKMEKIKELKENSHKIEKLKKENRIENKNIKRRKELTASMEE